MEYLLNMLFNHPFIYFTCSFIGNINIIHFMKSFNFHLFDFSFFPFNDFYSFFLKKVTHKKRNVFSRKKNYFNEHKKRKL